jgi:hypothetical protein
MFIYVDVFVHYETHFLKLYDMLSNIYQQKFLCHHLKKYQIVRLFFIMIVHDCELIFPIEIQ